MKSSSSRSGAITVASLLVTGGLVTASGASTSAKAADASPIPVSGNLVKPIVVHDAQSTQQADAALETGGMPIPTDTTQVALHVKLDIATRIALGFRADRAYVERLYANPVSTVGFVKEALFTPAEASRMELNRTLTADARDIQNYILASEYRQDFAGVAIDNNAGKVVVRIVNLSNNAAIVPVIARLAGGVERVDVRSAEVSLEHLLQLRSALTTDKLADSKESRISGTAVDILSNQLIVSSPTQAELRAVSKDLVDPAVSIGGLPSTVVRLEVAPQAGRPPIASTPMGTVAPNAVPTSGPPWYGGQRANVINKEHAPEGLACTNGFAVNDWGSPGTRYMLTAGHCWHSGPHGSGSGLPNKVQSPDGTLMGMGAKYRVVAAYDMGVYQVVNNQTSNKVSYAPGYAHLVTSWTTGAVQGAWLCAVGATTNGQHCGTVTSVSASTNDSTGLIQTNMGVLGGDSGGPLYQFTSGNNVDGIGITHSCPVTGSPDRRVSNVSYFTPLGNIFNFGLWWGHNLGIYIGG